MTLDIKFDYVTIGSIVGTSLVPRKSVRNSEDFNRVQERTVEAIVAFGSEEDVGKRRSKTYSFTGPRQRVVVEDLDFEIGQKADVYA